MFITNSKSEGKTIVNTLKATSLVLFMLVILPVQSAGAFEKINKGYFGGVAVGGYDAVAYFTQSKAVAGSKQFKLTWEGADWLFSNRENLAMFKEQPEKYAPSYGGYCSNQMSLGNISDIDPEVWQVIGGRLFLFGHDAGRQRWATETSDRIDDADTNWKKMSGGN